MASTYNFKTLNISTYFCNWSSTSLKWYTYHVLVLVWCDDNYTVERFSMIFGWFKNSIVPISLLWYFSLWCVPINQSTFDTSSLIFLAPLSNMCWMWIYIGFQGHIGGNYRASHTISKNMSDKRFSIVAVFQHPCPSLYVVRCTITSG